MAIKHGVDKAEIRELMDMLGQGIRAMDLDRLKECFAPDIVSFDVGPRLQDVGVDAKLRNWAEAFQMFQHPDYEIRDLTITMGEGMAFAHGFNRLSGTLKNGNNMSAPWVRWTAVFRKTDGRWRIVHDHVSVPMDFENGRVRGASMG